MVLRDYVLTPAEYAYEASGHKWSPARHLQLINEKLLDVYNGDTKFLMLTIPPRHGKACSIDTPIPTPDGWTTMADLIPGDKVFTEHGFVTTVTAATDLMFDHDCYEVVFVDGARIVADADHNWLVSTEKNGETGVIRTTHEILKHLHVSHFIPAVGKRTIFSREIYEIKPVESVPVKCITVSNPTCLFQAGEGRIVTHNSMFISEYFTSWFIGMKPDKRVILTSYEADFAASWGRKARDLLQVTGRKYFPTDVRLRGDSTAAARWDIEGHTGGMITAGAGGPITGKGGDLIVIDDPIKNADVANSETARNQLWDWYKSTLYTRLEPKGSLILCMTRWHQDDLAGRLIEDGENGGDEWDVVHFPAIAMEGDALGRPQGAPLWPARYNTQALTAIKRTLGEYWFNSLYQNSPIPPGGSMFKREWFEIVQDYPRGEPLMRFWDQAGTQDGGDYTAGALLTEKNGIVYVVDMIRGQWSPLGVEQITVQTADLDGMQTKICIEQEPGSSGKKVIDHYVRQVLFGRDVKGIAPSDSKEIRANPFAAAAEAGNVKLVKGKWNKDCIEELINFPHGKHDDQVDAISGAFNELIVNKNRRITVRARSSSR